MASVIAIHNGDNVSTQWTAVLGVDSYEGRCSDDASVTWQMATVPAGGTVLTIKNASSEKTYVVGRPGGNTAGNRN